MKCNDEWHFSSKGDWQGARTVHGKMSIHKAGAGPLYALMETRPDTSCPIEHSLGAGVHGVVCPEENGSIGKR
jgi:hypothetical protein